MGARKESFAETIRVAARQLRGTFTCRDLADKAELYYPEYGQKVRYTVRDFVKRGEMERVDTGLFHYVGHRGKDAPVLTEKRKVMWRILQMRRIVSVEDLQELAGVSVAYAREWLQNLTRQEIVRKLRQGAANTPCKWQLINDIALMPDNDEKNEKLRQIRARKKKALSKALETIQAGVDQARKAMEDI